MATPRLPRRRVNAIGCPRCSPPTITLPLGNRREIQTAIEALIDVLDQKDRGVRIMDTLAEPQFVITAAGRRALEAGR